jgi:large subunit ribosomal protein L5
MNAVQLNTKDVKEKLFEELKTQYGNLFKAPKISKLVINIGVGKFDSKEKQEIYTYLSKLTLQKPRKILTKKSISNFKLKKGDLAGIMVTLRGDKIYSFLINLIYLSLPRTRDFKGIKAELFDKSFKTYSFGIKSSNIFPVIDFSSNVDFGMQINLTFKEGTTENIKVLELLNFPFSKQ